MDCIEKVIIEYVKRSQNEYSDHSAYRKYLEKMEKTPLAHLDEIQVTMIVRPFLYEWGKMGRVLGRKEFKEWEREVAEQVHSNTEKLNEFRTMSLLNTSLKDYKEDIIRVYGSFKIIVEQIAATKVLHVLCPNFFCIWDNPIAEAFRTELLKTAFNNMMAFPEERPSSFLSSETLAIYSKNMEDFSAEDYYRFMLGTRDFAKRHENTFLALAKRYKKSVVKILDDFFWMTAHRPFLFFFQESSTT